MQTFINTYDTTELYHFAYNVADKARSAGLISEFTTNPITQSIMFDSINDSQAFTKALWVAQDKRDANKWKPQYIVCSDDEYKEKGAAYLGLIEFEDNSNEWHYFEIFQSNTHLIFGGINNTGFIESGNFKIDSDFSNDENLQELLVDLESYYNDGAGYQSDSFACNDRM